MAGARACRLPAADRQAKAHDAMLAFDRLAKTKGRPAACSYAESVTRTVRTRTE